MSVPSTPSRRSQRFQPTATPTSKTLDKNVLDCSWIGRPIYTRRTVPELDLLPEELEENEREDMEDNDEEVTDEHQEARATTFYEAFTMKRKGSAWRGFKKMQMSKTETQTYRVGDTIMVETDTLYMMKRPPSIGVIVALWEVRSIEDVGEHLDPSKMRIRIHWFLRPTELASIRAKREHEENEIFYSLSTRAILTPAVVLSRCLVTGSKSTTKQEKYDYVLVTPSKRRPSSPLKKSTRFAPTSDDEHEDEEEEEPTPKAKRLGKGKTKETSTTVTPISAVITDQEKIFYCRLAVDSRRGLFFNLNWDKHHSDALGRNQPPSSSDAEAGPSTKPEDEARWGEGAMWDAVAEKKAKATRPKGTVAKSRKGKSVRRGKEVAQSLSDEENEISESEADDSDVFQSGGEGSDSDVDMEGDSEEGDEDTEEDEEELDLFGDPRTPRKRKRTAGALSTPRKKKTKTFVQPTPHSKRALARRNRDANSSPRKAKKATYTIRVPNQSQSLLSFQSSMAHLPKDLWLRSMHALHVGSRPEALPCRDTEYTKVLRSVGDLLEEGSGGCVYISGVPGTGKTATVHSIVKELKRMAENNEINPFTYVEINGLKIPEPAAAYTLLWEGVSGHDAENEGHLRLSPKESLKALMRYFMKGGRGPEGHACVVLMDELDQLVTPKQDVVYNFFNWPTLVGSKLVVIAVANTMDLPERVMTGRVRSRLGMIRINFQPYTREQLEKIVEARLTSATQSLTSDIKKTRDMKSKDGKKKGEEEKKGEDEDKPVIAVDAIKFAAMTVSRITGDARRVLDICRRSVELVHPTKATAKVPHVKEVVQMMQNSPTAAYLRDLSFHERLMLTSLVKCIKREGVEEIKWAEIQNQHLIYTPVLTSSSDPTRKPSPAELTMILDSLIASRAVIVEEGALIDRKAEGERRVILNIEQGEVERVLGDVGGARWKGVLNN